MAWFFLPCCAMLALEPPEYRQLRVNIMPSSSRVPNPWQQSWTHLLKQHCLPMSGKLSCIFPPFGNAVGPLVFTCIPLSQSSEHPICQSSLRHRWIFCLIPCKKWRTMGVHTHCRQPSLWIIKKKQINMTLQLHKTVNSLLHSPLTAFTLLRKFIIPILLKTKKSLPLQMHPSN